MLTYMLSSRADIICVNEIFNLHLETRKYFHEKSFAGDPDYWQGLHPEESTLDYLDRRFLRFTPHPLVKAYGYKQLVGQQNTRQIIDFSVENNIQIFTTLRHPLAALASIMESNRDDYWNIDEGGEAIGVERPRQANSQPVYIDYRALKEYILGCEKFLSILPYDTCFIKYEDLVRDTAETFNTVLQYLDLKECIFKVNTQKLRPWNIEQRVSNYRELLDGMKIEHSLIRDLKIL